MTNAEAIRSEWTHEFMDTGLSFWQLQPFNGHCIYFAIGGKPIKDTNGKQVASVPADYAGRWYVEVQMHDDWADVFQRGSEYLSFSTLDEAMCFVEERVLAMRDAVRSDVPGAKKKRTGKAVEVRQ